MRFAFKTAPQHTTWDAMLDVWRAADDIELFESGWTFDHFYPIFGDSPGRVPGGLDHAGRAGPGHPPAAARHAGDRHPLPASGRPGEHGGDARHHVRRPAGAWHRRWLEREESGAYGIELGTPEGAQRPVRGGLRGDDRPAVAAGDHHVQGPLLPAHRRAVQSQASAAAAPADLHRRQRREAHAAYRGPVRPALELRRRHARAVPPRQGRAVPALRRHRPRSGRDPAVQPRAVHR